MNTLIYVMKNQNQSSTSSEARDNDTDDATRTWYGRVIRKPQNYVPHAMSSEYCRKYSVDVPIEETLLQPQYAAYEEPNPFALVCEYMCSFIAADPDTMTLAEALREPDKE